MGTWHDPDLGRPIAAPLERCAELLGVDSATLQELAADIEPYICADGTRIWSLMQLERQLRPECATARRLPSAVRERYKDEWLADLNALDHAGERPISQLLFALSIALRLRTLAGVTTNRRAAVGHGRPIPDEIDLLLDEIDEVLEEDAEPYVRNYVMKGGE